MRAADGAGCQGKRCPITDIMATRRRRSVSPGEAGFTRRRSRVHKTGPATYGHVGSVVEPDVRLMAIVNKVGPGRFRRR